MNNLSEDDYALFFQKNTTYRAETMEWWRYYDENYDKTINRGFKDHLYVNVTEPKSRTYSNDGIHFDYFNIFIMNYDEQ